MCSLRWKNCFKSLARLNDFWLRRYVNLSQTKCSSAANIWCCSLGTGKIYASPVAKTLCSHASHCNHFRAHWWTAEDENTDFSDAGSLATNKTLFHLGFSFASTCHLSLKRISTFLPQFWQNIIYLLKSHSMIAKCLKK